MKKSIKLFVFCLAFCTTATAFAQDTLKVDWKANQKIKAVPTLQVVVNAKLRRGSNIHPGAFDALKKIDADYVRFCPWFPYPKLGVAELKEPKDGKTSWDFSLMDPIVEDFMNATKGHPVVMTFSTTPQWMWKAEWYSGEPADPDQEEWQYNGGTELKDGTGKQVGEYFRRVYEWYTKGGFTDELGKKHSSGHFYKFEYWEVLNEPDAEHSVTPRLYNIIYDATAAEIRKVDPSAKFVGASLMRIPDLTPTYMETFLDPKLHRSGTPLDAASFHAYVWIDQSRGAEVEQYTAFEQSRQFIDQFYYIQEMRDRLSPKTKLMVNEVGTIRADDMHNSRSSIEPWYWSLSGGVFAYLYSEFAWMGVDLVGESQLVGYKGQFPCVSMVDWETGEPNLRYYALKLIKDNLAVGDKVLGWEQGTSNRHNCYARPFIDKTGKKKLLLVNQRNKNLTVIVPGAQSMQYVDESALAVQKKKVNGTVELSRFGVAVVEVE